MYKEEDILIGCDPEVFVFNEKDRCISGHDLIEGTKSDPFPVECGAIQVDGVALEYNIEPTSKEEVFVYNNKVVFRQLRNLVKLKNPSFMLKATPVVKFPLSYWKTIPEFNKELGCQPDYDAYTLKENDKPKTNKPMRTGAGHVHISWGESPKESLEEPSWMEKCSSIVRAMDEILLPESKKWDSNEERRELYGKAGAFRPKIYGLEYRVLSNAWVTNESAMRYVFRAAQRISKSVLNFEKNFVMEPYVA